MRQRDKSRLGAAGGRVESNWGRKKKGKGKEDVFIMMTRGSVLSPCPRPGCALPDTLPRHFSLGSTRPSLRGISASTFTIVDRDLLPPQNNALSYVVSLFSLVSVTSSPCHLIFHIPSDVSTNPASHATAKRHQSHHPIPSQISRSPPMDLPCPHSPRPPHLASSCLASPSAPPCSPHSHVPFATPCA
jgi:hypothetical protein